MLHCHDMGAVNSLRHFPRLLQLRTISSSLIKARSNGSAQAQVDRGVLKEKVHGLVKGIAYETDKGFVNVVGKSKQFDHFLTGTLSEIKSMIPASYHANVDVDELLEGGHSYPQQSPQQRKALLDTVKASMHMLIDILDDMGAGRRAVKVRQGTNKASNGKTAAKLATSPQGSVSATASAHCQPVDALAAASVLREEDSGAILEDGIESPGIAVVSGDMAAAEEGASIEAVSPVVYATPTLIANESAFPTYFDGKLVALRSLLTTLQASKFKLIFFDLETTDFRGKIAELAAYAPESGDVISTLINISPHVMSSQATEVTGITTAMVTDTSLPNISHVANDFGAMIQRQCTQPDHIPVLVAHNGFTFDLSILKKELQDVCMAFPPACWALDTLRLATHLSKRKLSREEPSPKMSHALQSLREHYVIPESPAHRALGDVVTLAEVFARQFQEFQLHVEPCDLDSMMENYTSVFVRTNAQLQDSPKKPPKKSESKRGTRTSGSRFVPAADLASDVQLYMSGTVEGGEAAPMQLPESSANVLYLAEEQLLGSWGGSDPADMLSSTLEDRGDVIPDLEGLWSAALYQSPLTSAVGCTLLDTHISALRTTLTPTMRRQLLESGFGTLHDVLQYYPKGYSTHVMDKLEDGASVVVVGLVSKAKLTRAQAKNLYFWKCEVSVSTDADVDQCVKLTKVMKGPKGWWALKTLADRYGEGQMVTIKGKVQQKKGFWEMDSSAEFLEGPVAEQQSSSQCSHVTPIYSQCGAIKPPAFERIMGHVLDAIHGAAGDPGDAPALDAVQAVDPVPQDVVNTMGLMSLRDAYKGMHKPSSLSDIEPARQRLAFTELLLLQLSMLIKREVNRCPRDAADVTGVYISQLAAMRAAHKSLPYALTAAQTRVLDTILDDMQRARPMMRLLQGDVGCGKTIVAFLAMLAVSGSGWQCALMAPTEVLAEQHYKNFLKLVNAMPEAHRPRVTLLTGSLKLKRKAEVQAALAAGEIDVAIGTHALISEAVNYKALGLAIIDEQHRFGVEQRARLQHRFHPRPHVLAMTATPIPRTLALVQHGDMGVLVIDEMPPGRAPTVTRVLSDTEQNREEVFGIIRDEVSHGNRCYIVYPLVEESSSSEDIRAAEAEFAGLQSSGVLGGYSCGLMTGRMSAEHKYEALHKFAMGETPVLVATTVVEVGVDVPEASVMVVEHAERFGLAQLHQLRGRVGRGGLDSHCFLLSAKEDLSRLQVLERTQDGLAIAEADLVIRGPGELFGKKQAGREGVQSLKTCKLPQDRHLVEAARRVAGELIEQYGLDPQRWPQQLLAAMRDSKVPMLDLVPAKTIGLDS